MKRLLLTLVVTLSLAGTGCAGKHIPILVTDAAIATVDSIDALSDAGKQLEQASVISASLALGFQGKLKTVIDKMRELPPVLRTIDRLQKAGDSSTADTEKAIALLTVVSEDLSVVIAGIPASDAAKRLIDLVRAADRAVSGILVQVAQIRGRQ